MTDMETKLQVKDLRVSFRTTNGKVQAVRGINFDLATGETLAIVGESGSGKSVTSKAILGILAGNSIIEGGEIIYDGKDLLKISEEDFHRLRGDKIAMIFQDPMSSLNPIVKIGKQLTEAMILKGKARQKENRRNFNETLSLLEASMIAALAPNDPLRASRIKAKCADFKHFEDKHLELEYAYNNAREAAEEAVIDIEPLLFELEKHAAKDLHYRLKDICARSMRSFNTYVVAKDKARVTELARVIPSLGQVKLYGEDLPQLREALTELHDILSKALTRKAPNFFAMGYYITFRGNLLPDMRIKDLNVYLLNRLDEDFMLEFVNDTRHALIWSATNADAAKREAIAVLKKDRAVFSRDTLNKAECKAAIKEMAAAVKKSIDKLELNKDSFAYTFETGMNADVEKYFSSIGRNAKEEKRFAKQTARHEALKAKGKEPDWTVVAASVTDLELVKKNLLNQIDRLVRHYEELLSSREGRDFHAEAVGVIDYLKACAGGVVKKVTKRMAKDRAIKLMGEVGIPDPRKRYNQYPFEFSGGMRQRIVIAIALAADPDILICDEPTTALDVTIQSQILELINKLKERRNLSIIFITHDLGVVANMADRIAVMYAGKIVEYGTSSDVFYESAHPYTWALLSSMPDLDTKEKLDAIPGTPPDMLYPPVGDAFAARNKYAMQIDFEKQPPMFSISETHGAATWLLHPDAPKVERPKIISDRIARMEIKRASMPAPEPEKEVVSAELEEEYEEIAETTGATIIETTPKHMVTNAPEKKYRITSGKFVRVAIKRKEGDKDGK